MSYSVRVVAKHLSTLDPIPWKLISVSTPAQLQWGVIKFLIQKDLCQFKSKTYTHDIDGRYSWNSHEHTFEVTDNVLRNATIIYNRVPIHYKERIHFIPHLAVEYTMDIDENKIKTQYY